jgi:hypothetical protein|nr:MAG TPA: Flagellin, PadR, transcription factor, DNA.8A [Caudoviricetes sp.]
MTNKDVIIKVLNERSCLTAMEVRQFAKRLCNYDISSQAVAGAMRPLIAAGLAASDKHPSNGKTIYWLRRD